LTLEIKGLEIEKKQHWAHANFVVIVYVGSHMYNISQFTNVV
jgi:hypothetical protein